MASAIDVLRDGFGRTAESLPALVSGLSVPELLWRPDPGSNSVAWLVWHLTRVQDDHVAAVGAVEQVWTANGWVERFALPYAAEDTGWSHTSDQVGAFTLEDPELLTGYQAAVHELTMLVLDRETEQTLDRVVDPHWDPPVTAVVRLVSVVDDLAQHTGQAAYLRGLIERRRTAPA
jgi:hypothetical protein